MANIVKIKYNDKTYELGFNRKTVKLMESRGFSPSELFDKPMTYIPMLFEGAFLMKHKFVKKDVIDSLFANLANKQELTSVLIDLYNNTFETLFDDPEENEGKVEWVAE